MKADQLAADVQAARSGFTDSEQMYPPAFFRHDVTVKAPNGQLTAVNPRLCATDSAAIELAAVLSEERGYVVEPLLGGGPPNTSGKALSGSWTYSSSVAWLRFTLPTAPAPMLLNAGMVLDYFNHGFPPFVALNQAQAEIEEDAFNGGFTDVAPDVQKILAQR